MTYTLGVDLGTTYSAAAVHRDGKTEIVALAHRAMVMPSAVFVAADGEVLVGEPALRRGAVEPGRLAREFKRRMGDPVPILIGGQPHTAESLTALLLRRLTTIVAEQQGGPPDRTVLTFPANWGPHKQDLLAEAMRSADVRQGATLTEPEAAAIWYASAERVAPGETVAVYDLGGGTFDAAVLRKAASGFEVLGTPHGIDRLGGIDADEAVFRHVCRLLRLDLEALAGDEAARRGLARLRADCVDAKEALSADTNVTIPVALPDLHQDVRLTRGELEDMVRPVLEDSIHELRQTIASAGLETDDIDRVLLVGGASRMPIVADLVTAALGRPFFVDAHPKHVVALGAALAAVTGGADGLSATRPVPATAPVPEPPAPAPPAPVPEPPAPAPPAPVPEPPAPTPPADVPEPPAPTPPADVPEPPVPAPTTPAPPLDTPVLPAPAGEGHRPAGTLVGRRRSAPGTPPPEPEPDDRLPAPPPAPAEPGPIPADPEVDPEPPEPASPAPAPSAPGGPSRVAWVAVPVAVLIIGFVILAIGRGGSGGGGSDGSDGPPATEARPVVEGVPGGEVVDLAMFANDVPESFHPAGEATFARAQIVDMLYDGLTGMDIRDPEAPVVVPKVAEDYRTDDGATTWTFTIREGLRFSDGTPVLPSSFVRGWERATDPDSAADVAELFTIIDGVEARLDGEADSIRGLRADDRAMTLEVTLVAPMASFDALVTYQPFMPLPEAADRAGNDEAPIGNGPFMAAEPMTDDGTLVLVPNPQWDGSRYDPALLLPEQPFLEQVTFRASDDMEAAYAAFEDGAGDVSLPPSGTQHDAREAHPDTFDGPFFTTYHLRFGWDDPHVGGAENRLLRLAVARAVDRDAVNTVLSEGTARPATGITAPGTPGFADGLCDHCTFAPDEAQDAFTAWEAEGNTLDSPLALQSPAPPGSSDLAVATMVDNLNAAGIPAVEEPLGDSYFERLAAGDCQVCVVGAHAFYPAYDALLTDLFHSRNVDRRNFGGFAVDDFDELADRAAATPAADERTAIYHAAERRLLNDDVGTVPILWHPFAYVYADRLADLPQTGPALIAWEKVYLDG